MLHWIKRSKQAWWQELQLNTINLGSPAGSSYISLPEEVSKANLEAEEMKVLILASGRSAKYPSPKYCNTTAHIETSGLVV